MCCLEETHLKTIAPPLTLIYIGNGCEGYSTNIYIPSKKYLTRAIDTLIRHDFLLVSIPSTRIGPIIVFGLDYT